MLAVRRPTGSLREILRAWRAGELADAGIDWIAELAPEKDTADPNKGAFGGRPEAHGRCVRVLPKPLQPKARSLGRILRVESTDPETPLAGEVAFYLHMGLPPSVVTVDTLGHADLELDEILTESGLTVRTIGVGADGGTSRLELDLTLVPSEPSPSTSPPPSVALA